MESHALAGKTVKLKSKSERFNGSDFRVIDYWKKLNGKSWMDTEGNPACLQYAVRSEHVGLPMDDKVVYGKIKGLGYLVHESELTDEQIEAEGL